jgi:hypothetical protein
MDEVITARAGETLVDLVRRVYHLSPELRPLRVASVVAQYNQNNRLAVGNNVGHPLGSDVKITCPPWKDVLARLQDKTASLAAKDTRGAMARAMDAPVKLSVDRDRDNFVRALARIAAADLALAKNDFGAAVAKGLTPKDSAQLFDGGVAETGAALRAARTWLTKTSSAADATESFSNAMGVRFDREALSECAQRKAKIVQGLASGACPVTGHDVSRAFAAMETSRVIASLKQLMPGISPRVFRSILQRVLAVWGVAAGEWSDRFLASGEDETMPVEFFLTTFDAQALDGPIAAWLWQQSKSQGNKAPVAWQAIATAIADLAHDDTVPASACVLQHGTEILRRLRGNETFTEPQARAFLAGRNFLKIRGETREQVDRQLSLHMANSAARGAVMCLFLAHEGSNLALMKKEEIAKSIGELM